jgi:hypothetical protein
MNAAMPWTVEPMAMPRRAHTTDHFVILPHRSFLLAQINSGAAAPIETPAQE